MIQKVHGVVPVIKKITPNLTSAKVAQSLPNDEFIRQGTDVESIQKLNPLQVLAKRVLNFFQNKPIKSFKCLNSDEYSAFNKSINSFDNIVFSHSFNNAEKPAAVLLGSSQEFKIYQKLQETNSNFDVVDIKPLRKGDRHCFFVINKPMVQDIIKNNKKVFTHRLDLDETATPDEIYRALTDKNGVLAKHGTFALGNFNDISGLILGYPKINSMIFELEKRTEGGSLLREEISVLKTRLLDTLYGENSPYKGIGDDFMENLAKQIKSITEIKESSDKLRSRGYTFISFVDEPKEIERIMCY